MSTLRTLDAHAGGAALRLLVDGVPTPRGRTMTERLAWARAHAQDVRRVAMCEPRGHAGLRGAILTEPGDTTAHAGVLFMDADDYHAGSVHGAMATAALARDYGLITTGDATLRLDTAAGVVQVTTTAGDAVRTGARVSIASVPAFVARGGLALAVAGRALRADVAYGGDFYAIVDAESAGVSIDGTRDADLQRLARAVADAIAPHRITQHPTRPELTGLRGVVFTGPAQRSPAEFRSVVVTTAGRVSRGVSGSGMAAVLAVLDAMGLPLDDGITLEGALGTTLAGRVGGRVALDEVPAIVPVLSSTVWLTGEHTLVCADGDRLLRDDDREV